MKRISSSFIIVIASCTLLLLFSACSTSSTTTTEQSTSPFNPSSSSATSTPSASDTFGVKVAQVNVKGKSELVLTDARGFTLYTFKPDTATRSACTGACAKTWPPLLAQKEGQTSFDHLTLGAVKDDNGIQVQANDHFLYTFSKDTAPGQANGEGVAGKWFVATPT